MLEPAPERCSLSKLINSVTNYKKRSGNDFKIDVSSIKPSRLFHANSSKTIGLASRNNNHSFSFMEKSKTKNNSQIKLDNNSIINTSQINEIKKQENIKKSIIDYFPVDKLIRIETKFIVLMSKIKNAKQLWEEYIIYMIYIKLFIIMRI